MEILDDLNVVSKELGGSSVSEKVLLKIKNTMSDRHSAENCFHSCYKSLKAPFYQTLSLVGIKSQHMNKHNLLELTIFIVLYTYWWDLLTQLRLLLKHGKLMYVKLMIKYRGGLQVHSA